MLEVYGSIVVLSNRYNGGQGMMHIYSNLTEIWANYERKNDQCNGPTSTKSEPNHI